MAQAEFDRYAHAYKELLREPIRDRFAQDPRFYTERTWILLRDFFERQGRSMRSMSRLDVGCGEGDLLRHGQVSRFRFQFATEGSNPTDGDQDQHVHLSSAASR